MSSDWKEGAVKRRDARNTKSPNEVPKPGAGNAKKNTKRWCRGKAGVEHKPECRDYSAVKGRIQQGSGPATLRDIYKGWKILVCTECGKELAHYYPFGSSKKNPPPWVK